MSCEDCSVRCHGMWYEDTIGSVCDKNDDDDDDLAL